MNKHTYVYIYISKQDLNITNLHFPCPAAPHHCCIKCTTVGHLTNPTQSHLPPKNLQRPRDPKKYKIPWWSFETAAFFQLFSEAGAPAIVTKWQPSLNESEY